MPRLNKDDLNLWKRRLQVDLAAQAVYHDRWKRAIRLFDTSFWDTMKAQNPSIVEVNYSTTFITTLVSAVFARAPRWRIEAKRPGRFYKFAETMTILMEQFKEEAKLKKLATKAVVDASTCNIGWIEQGYFQSQDNPLPSASQEDGIVERMSTLLRQLGQDPQQREEESAQLGELHEQKRPGSFYLLRRSPWDVIVPEGSYEYESMPYLFVRERMTWEDFIRNPRYKHQDRIGTLALPRSMRKLDNVKTSNFSSVAPFNPKAPSGRIPHDLDRPVELFTVWDRRENQVFTMSESSDMPHEDAEGWPYYGEGFPQKPLQFNYVPEIPDERDNFYGFSDIDPIYPQLIEKSDLRTQQTAIRKRAIVKVFVQQGSATESNLEKMASPDIELIPVQNINAIQISQPMQIPPAVLQTEDRIDSDLSRDSGMSLLLSDASQQGKVQRATVANLAQQQTTLKTSYKVDAIESWIKQIGLYQVGLYWQFLDVNEVGERLGRLPKQEEWIPLPESTILAKKWIRDELKLSVETGSTKPLNVDVLERDNYMNSLAVIQQVAPNLFAQLQRQFISVLVKKFNEPALEQIVLASMDQEEEQAALMENQLMAQGMLQVVSPNDDHETHLKVHAQQANDPVTASHIQAHNIRIQELLGQQQSAGQGVRQSAAAPSAAEIGQGGTTRGVDLNSASNNLGPGSAQAGVA